MVKKILQFIVLLLIALIGSIISLTKMQIGAHAFASLSNVGVEGRFSYIMDSHDSLQIDVRLGGAYRYSGTRSDIATLCKDVQDFMNNDEKVKSYFNEIEQKKYNNYQEKKSFVDNIYKDEYWKFYIDNYDELQATLPAKSYYANKQAKLFYYDKDLIFSYIHQALQTMPSEFNGKEDLKAKAKTLLDENSIRLTFDLADKQQKFRNRLTDPIEKEAFDSLQLNTFFLIPKRKEVSIYDVNNRISKYSIYDKGTSSRIPKDLHILQDSATEKWPSITFYMQEDKWKELCNSYKTYDDLHREKQYIKIQDTHGTEGNLGKRDMLYYLFDFGRIYEAFDVYDLYDKDGLVSSLQLGKNGLGGSYAYSPVNLMRPIVNLKKDFDQEDGNMLYKSLLKSVLGKVKNEKKNIWEKIDIIASLDILYKLNNLFNWQMDNFALYTFCEINLGSLFDKLTMPELAGGLKGVHSLHGLSNMLVLGMKGSYKWLINDSFDVECGLRLGVKVFGLIEAASSSKITVGKAIAGVNNAAQKTGSTINSSSGVVAMGTDTRANFVKALDGFELLSTYAKIAQSLQLELSAGVVMSV